MLNAYNTEQRQGEGEEILAAEVLQLRRDQGNQQMEHLGRVKV